MTPRAKVISVVALKGGVGKSTISRSLAATLHTLGRRVVLLDADGQGTLMAWSARAEELGRSAVEVVPAKAADLRRDLERVAGSSEFVVIDTPARIGKDARVAMQLSDLVLIPTGSGGEDFAALKETLAELAEVTSVRDLRALVVRNRIDRTELTALGGEALEGLGIDVLPAMLGSRVVFPKSFLAGVGPVEYAPKSRAADETRSMTRAVLRALGEKIHGKREK